MSHLSSVKTKINNGDRLLQALKELGYAAVKHSNPVQLYNRYAYLDNELRFADIIIPAKSVHATADVGFAKDLEGNYELISDESMNIYNPLLGKDFQPKVIGKYAELTVQDFIQKTGATIVQDVSQDGIQTIVIQQKQQQLSILY